MYAPDVTARQVAAVNEARVKTHRPPLVYHTSGQIQAAILHLDDLIDDQTRLLKRKLSPDETAFIRNERKLCALDWTYWSRHYAKIVNWEKKVVLFSPNVAQRMVIDIWGDLERAGRAIMMQQLKARQLGVTTLTEIAVAHRVQFWPRVNAVVASADPQKSLKMANMIDFCWEEQPWWLIPSSPQDKVQNGMTVEYARLNSSILVQAGNQFNGVARGQTPNVFHLSELCEWDDPDLLVDAALLKAIHETPDVFGILESTALGRGNWWHNTWKQTKEDFPRGRSRLCPIFLPWYVGVDIYPTETDLRMRPIPRDWIPSDLTVLHAARAREYVLANPLLFEHLAHRDPGWTMSLAQMWFYEIERDAAIRKKQLNLFLSEMPADDQEAFQSTNISAFNTETILVHRSHARQPVGVYTIVGTGIPDDLVCPRSEWVPDGEIIPISAGALLKTTEQWFLVPVKFEGYSGTSAGLKLFIWEWPEEGEQYGLGVDTSDGVGADWSVIQVLHKRFPAGPDEQAAEFASPYIKALQFWPHVLCLATLYSTLQPRLMRRTQCRVAIECRGNGETVQFELQKRGWSNFHPWKKLDNKRPTLNHQTHKIGVFTNAWYRPMMMDRLMTMLEDETLRIHSPWFVDEMEALEKDETRQSLKATYGEHDDRIMALGFILDSLHVDDRPYGRSAYAVGKRPAGVIGRMRPDPVPTPQYAPYRPGLQARDLPGRAALGVSRSRNGGITGVTRMGRNVILPRRFQ